MSNRYATTKKTKLGTAGAQYYTNTVYPTIPVENGDYYVITTLGDRLDLIANQLYGDSSLWWIIASANALPGDSLYPPIGVQLRIPANYQKVVNSYQTFNNVRL